MDNKLPETPKSVLWQTVKTVCFVCFGKIFRERNIFWEIITCGLQTRPETQKWVLWLTVTTLIKCCIIRNLTRVCTVCFDKIFRERNILFRNYNLWVRDQIRNPKTGTLHSVKTQMKCCIIRNLTRVCTVCFDKIFRERNILFRNYNL